MARIYVAAETLSMKLEKNKRICHECRNIFTADRILVAKHPFIDNAEVDGCPHCFGVDCLHCCCDEPGCWNEAMMGWPTKNWSESKVYRFTCYKHHEEF
jgi:hypothetical protein